MAEARRYALLFVVLLKARAIAAVGKIVGNTAYQACVLSNCASLYGRLAAAARPRHALLTPAAPRGAARARGARGL
jgi:hypothetical protein